MCRNAYSVSCRIRICMNAHTTFMRRKLARNEQHSFDFYVLLFFLLAFIGWLWEVGIYLVIEQRFINRGIYRGPYLPIYGVGGILLYWILHRLYKHPVWTFFLSALICSVVEYATSVFLEWKWGVRWWDYSGYAINLDGRICLIGAIAFGAGGTLLNCCIMPIYMRLYHKVSFQWRMVLCLLLIVLFAADAAFSAIYPHTGYGISTSIHMLNMFENMVKCGQNI